MKNNNKYILIIIMLLAVTISNAQQNAVLTHYTINPYLYNAAQVGESGYTTLSTHYRKQWINMPDAPDTKFFSAQTMLKDKVGLGMKVYYDQVHVIKNFGALFTYAYKLKFNKENTKDHYLSVGLSGGFKSQTINFNEATLKDEFDPSIFYEGASNTVFDAEAGLKYKNKGLNVGIFASNISPQSYNYKKDLSNLEFTPTYHLYGSLGYDYKFGEKNNMTLKPSVLARYIPNIPIQMDANLILDWKQSAWIGAGYRYNNVGVWGIAGLRLHDIIAVTYSYEQSIDGYQSPLGTSHEFSIELRFKGNKNPSEEDIMRKVNDKMGKMKEILLTKYEGVIDSLQDINHRLDSLANMIPEEVEQHIEEKASPVEHRGTMVKSATLGRVNFIVNSATIHKNQEVEAEAIFQQIAAVKDRIIHITIEGNASIEGSETYNLFLSNKRTFAMKDYLVKKGINEDLITTSSKGNSEALVRSSNNTDKGQVNPKDRYVRVFILFNE